MLASARRVLAKSQALVTTTTTTTRFRSTPTAWTRAAAQYTTTTTSHRASVTGNKSIPFSEHIRQLDHSAPSREQVLKLLSQARTAPERDINNVITLTKWFYQPHKGNLSNDILNDINMWKEAIKIGYGLTSKGHPNVLSMLVSAFHKRFPTDQIKDTQALEVLIRVCVVVYCHWKVSSTYGSIT